MHLQRELSSQGMLVINLEKMLYSQTTCPFR